MKHEITRSDRLCHHVLMAVSNAENTPWKSLPALSESVDPDRLTDLFASRDGTDRHGHVSFMFSESLVSINYDNHIRVEPIDNQHALDSETDRARSVKSTIDTDWQQLSTLELSGQQPTDGWD